MAATTTAFNNLLQQLRADFPELTFVAGDRFQWSARSATVTYDTSNPEHLAVLLHETAHGVLGHDSYLYDLDLIQLEREAWSTAIELGARYDVPVDEVTVEDALDTYRDWLHQRSICPQCGSNGVQTRAYTYACVICHQNWRVNEARTCGLKRTKI